MLCSTPPPCEVVGSLYLDAVLGSSFSSMSHNPGSFGICMFFPYIRQKFNWQSKVITLTQLIMYYCTILINLPSHITSIFFLTREMFFSQFFLICWDFNETVLNLKCGASLFIFLTNSFFCSDYYWLTYFLPTHFIIQFFKNCYSFFQ